MNTLFENKHPGKASTHEWLTPPSLIKSLGSFDLDPCSPKNRPWDTAKHHYTIDDDGLSSEWFGRVWCNPPYGQHSEKWIAKCINHKNAILLIFAKTETNVWQELIFKHAHSLFFIKGRVRFYKVSGKIGNTLGSPSVLVSFNQENTESISASKNEGHLVVL